jgi:hypothetical protein
MNRIAGKRVSTPARIRLVAVRVVSNGNSSTDAGATAGKA